MNEDKQRDILLKLYRRHSRLQLLSFLCLFFIAILVVGLTLFLFWGLKLTASIYTGGGSDDEMMLEMMNMYDKIILAVAVSVLVTVFGGIFKYVLGLANFWYSRAIALDLYKAESDLPLKELVAAFASERIDLLARTPLDKLVQTASRIKERM